MRTIFSFLFSRISFSLVARSCSTTGFAFRKNEPSFETASTVCSCVSGLSVVFWACGSFTATPCCNIGATSIMMMSSTSMTSTSGVTLMSALTPPFAPPRSIAMTKSPNCGSRISDCGLIVDSMNPQSAIPNPQCGLGRLLDEVVDELRRRVVHLDVEVLDARRQIVVDPDGRNRDDQTDRGLDERFRNTDRNRADAGRTAGADALERVDDADDRAEQSDERRRGADRGERRNALLQVGGGEGRGALNGAADGVHQVFAVHAGAA